MRRVRALSLALAVAGALLVPGAARAYQPPSFAVEWHRGGASAPYDLLPFRHPAAGQALFVAGNTGGVSAVGRGGPLWRWAAGNTSIAGVASGDLTGDGTDDVMVATYQPRAVTALDGVDGHVLAQRTFPSTPGGVAIGDADGDGLGDLYVVTQAFAPAVTTVHLFLGPDLEPAWSRSLSSAQDSVLAIDAGDTDGDGRADLAFGTYSNGPRVYLFGADGTKRWEVDLEGIVSDLAIADGGRTVFASRPGGPLASIDATTGAVRWSLPAASGFAKLAAADLNGDGTDDVAWVLYGAFGKSPLHQVQAVDGATGRPLWVHTTLTPPKAVVAGDIDGDGDADVVVSTQDAGPGGGPIDFVWAYDGPTGRPLWSHPFAGEQTTFLSDVTLADMAGDSRPEVVVAPYFDVLVGLDGTDGSPSWSMPVGSGVTSAAAADLDGDGLPETVEGGDDFRVTARRGDTGEVRWSRDLGGEVSRVATVPSGVGRDVLAIALSTIYRLRGSDGAVRWSAPLQGLGTTMVLIPQPSGGPLLAVGARLRRSQFGAGNNSLGGQLSLFDTVSGVVRWQVQTPGAPWYLDATDVNGDGSPDLAVGMTNNQLALAVLDGTRLEAAPVPLWQGGSDGGVGGLAVLGGNVVTTRASVNAVVAQDGASGVERWRRPMGTSVRLIGTADVNGDGTKDALVSTGVFSDGIAAVSGTNGQVLFQVPAGTHLVTAADWADVSGDGAADLLFTSDAGGSGSGVFALDGTTLSGSGSPRLFWTYPDVNATDLFRVAFEDGERWVAYGTTVRPDALTVLRPIPEEPDEE